MKHVRLFDDFLRDVVDLNTTRIATLEERVAAVQRFLRDAGYRAPIKRFSPQGSWAQGTIIRPPRDRNEFDADLVMFVDDVEDWEPKEYVNALYRTFSATNRYADKIAHRSRCVRIDYAGDFHLDVVPCIEREGTWETTCWVLNRDTNEEERAAPEAYAAWLRERNAIVGKNMLRKVIRLAKYQRDIKTNFSVKSILLTTLFGEQVTDWDARDRSPFMDVSTSLRTLFGRLDNWLRIRPLMPSVPNSVLPSEDLNRHWDQRQYTNFRAMIHKYRGWIDEAYVEENRDESVRKWRRVFGDEFGRTAKVLRETAATAPSGRLAVRADLVPAVTSGRIDLSGIPVWSHVQRPPWRRHGGGDGFSIVGWVHKSRHEAALHRLDSLRPLPKGRHLRFEASYQYGIPATFCIAWQVVNSGREADESGDLRGNFGYGDPGSVIRWERTAYRGVHWVEAFLVNRRTNECMARSGRLFVPVE